MVRLEKAICIVLRHRQLGVFLSQHLLQILWQILNHLQCSFPLKRFAIIAATGLELIAHLQAFLLRGHI